MKENFISLGRWVVAGILLLAIGVLMITGMGRKRGTRSYRWRMAMWAMLLGFTGAAPLAMMGCDDEKKDDSEEEYREGCYTVGIDAVEDVGQPRPEIQVTCYEPLPEEVRGTCYLVDMPDVCYVAPPEQDVYEACYGHMEEYDIHPQPDIPKPPEDIMVTCYVPALDVQPQDVPPVMCYDPAIDVQPQEDIPPVMCYDPAIDVTPQEEDVTPDEPDIPGPTCYAPPRR